MSTITFNEHGLIVACPHCGHNNQLPFERLDVPPRCIKCTRDFLLPAEPVELESEAALVALIRRSAQPVLVDFSAPSCESPGIIAQEVSTIAAEGAGRWLVARVNTEMLPEAAHHFAATSIPLLVLFRHGQEIARNVGALPAAAVLRFLGQVL